MKTKKLQLAHLYKGSYFYGYGLAVDGELLAELIGTTIKTLPGEPVVMDASFRISSEMEQSPIRIELERGTK
ncbi:hypothetical protein [Yersinia intermedia]|uniref:hypothetical protein n=1 Tax=Yersinia intermedia TaxID=631 RepID=UPI001F52DD3B|nr:hypothetical protein [Yersinia intermedia]UNK22391.1 hypothetical protein MNQ97_16600 [Yersinia intermedia]